MRNSGSSPDSLDGTRMRRKPDSMTIIRLKIGQRVRRKSRVKIKQMAAHLITTGSSRILEMDRYQTFESVRFVSLERVPR